MHSILVADPEMPRKKLSAKVKEINRFRAPKTARRHEVSPKLTESFTQCETPSVYFVPAVLCEEECSDGDIRARLYELVLMWVQLFHFHKVRHACLGDLLKSQNLIRVSPDHNKHEIAVAETGVFDLLDSDQANSLTTRVADTLRALCGMNSEYSDDMPPPLVPSELVDEESSLEVFPNESPRLIGCTVENVGSVSLHFRNTGMNGIESIQTYLQEKLDVLDFLQKSDQNRSSPIREPSGGSTTYSRTLGGDSPRMPPARLLLPSTKHMERSPLVKMGNISHSNQTVIVNKCDDGLGAVFVDKENQESNLFVKPKIEATLKHAVNNQLNPKMLAALDSRQRWETNSMAGGTPSSKRRSQSVGSSSCASREQPVVARTSNRLALRLCNHENDTEHQNQRTSRWFS